MSLDAKRQAQAEIDEARRLLDNAYKGAMQAAEGRAKAQNSQNNAETKASVGYNGDVSNSLKRRPYNEYNTIGMQWAYNASTKIGDCKILYKPSISKYVLVEATKDDVGFVELSIGTLKQMKGELKYYDEQKSRDNREPETFDRLVYRLENGQRNNDGNNVDAGYRREGTEDAEFSRNENQTDGTGSASKTERNNKENLNFSLKENNGTTSKDTKKLLDTIEKLKHEFEVTKFAKADPKKLTDMVKSILKDYNSRADFDGVRSDIDKLYNIDFCD